MFRKKEIFVNLPFKGDDCNQFLKRRLNSAMSNVFPAAKLVLINSTKKLPVTSPKDPLPLTANSSVIYKFQCTCSATYIGRTERQLSTRIAEHLPRWLSIPSSNNKTKNPTSAITKHILQSSHQTSNSPNSFTIVAQSTKFMLPTLESVAIRIFNPSLCIQKQFVKTLLLPW